MGHEKGARVLPEVFEGLSETIILEIDTDINLI